MPYGKAKHLFSTRGDCQYGYARCGAFDGSCRVHRLLGGEHRSPHLDGSVESRLVTSYALDARPVIDGTLGGKTEATEEELAAMVELLKNYIENGLTTIIVTGSQPAMIDVGSLTITAIGEAIYRLSKEESYNGKIDLVLPDVTEIVDQEFYGARALNSINLPKVTTVGDGAFYDCQYLEELTFGSVVTAINHKLRAEFYKVGEKVEGCDLVLNREQVNAEADYQPNLETRTWWNTEWKSITLK